MRRRLLAALLLSSQALAGTGEDNLADALKALSQSAWKEARLQALAALELMGEDAPAPLAVLAEAEDKLGHPEAAVSASWKLLPKGTGKDLLAARNRIRRLAPPLAAYLDARDRALADLGALQKKAEQQGWKADAERIQARILAIGGTPKEAPKGWVRFADAADWHWKTKPEGIQVQGDAMAFEVGKVEEFMCQHYVQKPPLTKDAGLRFSLKFSGGTPNLFFLLSGGKPGEAPDDMNAAMILDPDGRRLGFATYVHERGWTIHQFEDLPKGLLKPGVLQAWEFLFDPATRKMTVTVDQQKTFDQALRQAFEFGGAWGIGYGSPGRYEVGGFWVRQEPPKP